MKDTFNTPDVELSIKALRCFANVENVAIIIELKKHKRLNMSEIVEKMKPANISAISHVRLLVNYGIIHKEWENSIWYYKVNNKLVESMIAYITELKKSPYLG
jgi:predicted transcriptional regulator